MIPYCSAVLGFIFWFLSDLAIGMYSTQSIISGFAHYFPEFLWMYLECNLMFEFVLK